MKKFTPIGKAARAGSVSRAGNYSIVLMGHLLNNLRFSRR
jgi:hypothetical protein